MNESTIERNTPNNEYISNPNNHNKRYAMNDLASVYTHYDAKLGINVSTPNILLNKENDKNG